MIARLEGEVTQQYQRLRPQVFRYAIASGATPAEADDLVQEAFLRYFLALLAGDEIRNPQAWLLSSTRNLWITRIREKNRRKETVLEAADPQDCVVLDELEQRQLWEQMLALLAPRERECVVLRRDGLDYGEIAQRLGISGGTVGVLLHRARRRFLAPEAHQGVA
jgi:RNA polymerase sigma-70 factor (ECF subfamily)